MDQGGVDMGIPLIGRAWVRDAGMGRLPAVQTGWPLPAHRLAGEPG